ncbi:MAG: hypothetical protein JWL70_2527, partial [Acidimicrobiia bacterium]|nr:hypothetical protein [Acidimicrobiia bacterium]
MARQRCRGDDGVALMMTMVFIFVMGVVVSALLMQTTTTLRATVVTQTLQDRLYSA